MPKLKQNLSIILFLFFGLFITTISFFSSWERDERLKNQGQSEVDKTDLESYFTSVDYYVFDDEKNIINLSSNELTINSESGDTVFIRPKGIAYTEQLIPINYEAQIGFYQKAKNLLRLENQVLIDWQNSTMKSSKLEYEMLKDRMVASGGVLTESKSEDGLDNVKIESAKVVAYPKSNKSEYIGNVSGEVERKREYEQGVKFSSNRLSLDMNRNYLELNGDVVLIKQQLTASSHRGEIFLENYNKRLKYFALYDDVKVTEDVLPKGRAESSFKRKSYSEKLEGLMSEELIVLTGYPKVIQQGDTIKGNKITLRENNEVVEVDNANSNFRIR